MHLPLDVQKRIIRHLDIDTRRALNIYTRLKIPIKLQESISNCMIISSNLMNNLQKNISIRMNNVDNQLLEVIIGNLTETHITSNKKLLFIAYKLATIEITGATSIDISKNNNNIYIDYYHNKNVLLPFNALNII
jgi:hypothetical protein